MPVGTLGFILSHVVTAIGLPMPLWLFSSGTVYLWTTYGAARCRKGHFFELEMWSSLAGTATRMNRKVSAANRESHS